MYVYFKVSPNEFSRIYYQVSVYMLLQPYGQCSFSLGECAYIFPWWIINENNAAFGHYLYMQLGEDPQEQMPVTIGLVCIVIPPGNEYIILYNTISTTEKKNLKNNFVSFKNCILHLFENRSIRTSSLIVDAPVNFELGSPPHKCMKQKCKGVNHHHEPPVSCNKRSPKLHCFFSIWSSVWRISLKSGQLFSSPFPVFLSMPH